MRIKLLEKSYNNKVHSFWNTVQVRSESQTLVLIAENEEVNVELSFRPEEIHQLWAQLLSQDASKAKEVSERFSDNLSRANSLATRLGLDQYQDDAKRLEDMKAFVQIYADLIEHAKFGLASQKTLQQEQRAISDAAEPAEVKSKEREFDEEAKRVSASFEGKFPRQPLFSDDAVELVKILEEQERQKKEIKEQEEKRLKELREQAKEKEQKTIMTKPFDQKKGDVHVDTDYITVRPLFEEQKGMQKLNKRSTDLDAIDYSKL